MCGKCVDYKASYIGTMFLLWLSWGTWPDVSITGTPLETSAAR